MADALDNGHAAVGTDLAPRERQVTEEERRRLLREGAPKVPRKVVVWGFVVAAALALGGTIGERIFSAAGLNPTPAPTATTTTTTPRDGLSPASALLSFTPVPPARVPPLTLTDQRGTVVSLRAERGKVVVLTFFDASCTDLCSVMAAELRHTDADLGRLASRVVLVTVNTDPLRLAASPPPPAVTATGLDALANWHYLTGPLRALNPFWRALGVSISVFVDSKAVVHNDVLYVVDPSGRIAERGSPFSDESRRGVVSLPASLERVAGRVLAGAIARDLAR